MIKAALIIIFLLFMVSGQAQEKDTIYNKNEISFVVSELIDGGLHFRYERKLGENISVGFGTSIKTKKGLIKLSGIDTDQIKTGDINLSGFKLIPEVRYYLNKTSQYDLDGFYFGAYLKYANYHSNLNGLYINKQDEQYPIDSDANFEILTMGLAFGYKLALNNKWNLDFVIAGPGAGIHKYSLKNNTNLSDEFYEDLADALENYSLLDYLNSDFRFDVNDARTKFTIPAFRYGFAIGYTF